MGWQPPTAATAGKASVGMNRSSSSANLTEEFDFQPTGLQAAMARRGICIPCQLGELKS
jgi:hypothetical protein